MRTWMRLLPAVLLAIPATGSALRADADTDKKIENLQKEVADLRKDIERLRKDLTDTATQSSAVLEQLRSINRNLEGIAKEQDRISRYGPGAIPPGPVPSAPLPTTGMITVQNNYLAPATVRINDRPFVVAPGQTTQIGAPIGTFHYSVDVDGFISSQPPRTDNLPAAGYRITIFPQRPMF
jgi:TolA-binding protein